jgi:hypothetical protein
MDLSKYRNQAALAKRASEEAQRESQARKRIEDQKTEARGRAERAEVIRRYVQEYRDKLPHLLEEATRGGKRELTIYHHDIPDTLYGGCFKRNENEKVFFGHHCSESCLDARGQALVNMLRSEGFRVKVDFISTPRITARF